MADCGRRLEEWRTVDGACWLPWYAGVLMSGVWCLVSGVPSSQSAWTV